MREGKAKVFARQETRGYRLSMSEPDLSPYQRSIREAARRAAAAAPRLDPDSEQFRRLKAIFDSIPDEPGSVEDAASGQAMEKEEPAS